MRGEFYIHRVRDQGTEKLTLLGAMGTDRNHASTVSQEDVQSPNELILFDELLGMLKKDDVFPKKFLGDLFRSVGQQVNV